MYPATLMATKPQIQKINILLRQLGQIEHKEGWAMQFSNERTTHISELSKLEAKNLIGFLVSNHPSEKNKEAIISLAYKAGILYGYSWEDKKMNMAKLDQFLLSRGAVKKRFAELNYNDLTKVHRQFEGIVSNQRKTAANKATTSVLKELGIEVAKR